MSTVHIVDFCPLFRIIVWDFVHFSHHGICPVRFSHIWDFVCGDSVHLSQLVYVSEVEITESLREK